MLMILRLRRAAIAVGAGALAMGTTVALAASPSGAAPAPQPAAASATVGVNGLCGGVVPGVTPTDLREGASESNSLRVFREQLDFPLGSVRSGRLQRGRSLQRSRTEHAPDPTADRGRRHPRQQLCDPLRSTRSERARVCTAPRRSVSRATCSVCRCFRARSPTRSRSSCVRRVRTTRTPPRASSSSLPASPTTRGS